MFTFLFFLFTFPMLILYWMWDDLNYIREYIFVTWFSTVAGGILGYGVALFIGIFIPAETYEKHWTNEIECLADNSNTTGTFFLGTGQINGEMVYAYYQKDGDLFKLNTVKSYNTQVKYGIGTPILHTYEVTLKDGSMANNFATSNHIGDKRYVFEIPKGSILNQYKLDAQ